MLSASRYILNGSPHNCAFCREPLTVEAYRRDNAYYCNELCADAAPRQRRAEPADPSLQPIDTAA